WDLADLLEVVLDRVGGRARGRDLRGGQVVVIVAVDEGLAVAFLAGPGRRGGRRLAGCRRPDGHGPRGAVRRACRLLRGRRLGLRCLAVAVPRGRKRRRPHREPIWGNYAAAAWTWSPSGARGPWHPRPRARPRPPRRPARRPYAAPVAPAPCGPGLAGAASAPRSLARLPPRSPLPSLNDGGLPSRE